MVRKGGRQAWWKSSRRRRRFSNLPNAFRQGRTDC